MKIGDRVRYNTKEIVTILNISGNYCLVLFESGTRICTNLNSLKLL